MKRTAFLASMFVAATLVSGCGDTGSIFGDGGSQEDMTIKLFQMKAGVWTIKDLRSLNDGCKVNPTDVVGTVLALQNDGAGVIKLGGYDMNTKQPTPDVGIPPQPSNGQSCPGTNNPPQCATEPMAKPFNNNVGWLVRDNKVDDLMGCTFNRHIKQIVTLTADNKFTADYTRNDTNHAGCVTQTTDCTTTWLWDLEFTKAFGQ